MKNEETKKEWANYGDLNPEHGSVFLKKEGDDFRIIKTVEVFDTIDPEKCLVIEDVLIDISDSWIEKDQVLSFIGGDETTPDEVFAVACLDYYGPENFGGDYITDWSQVNFMTLEELIEAIKKYGINKETCDYTSID